MPRSTVSKAASTQPCYLSFDDDDDVETGLVTTLLYDTLLKQQIFVKSKYLAGADGANSKVAQQLNLPFTEKPFGGLALNIEVEVDLSHMMSGPNSSPGLLHTQLLMENDNRPEWGVYCVTRCIQPWNKWLCILAAAPWVTEIHATEEEIQKRVEECFGDPSLEIKVMRISRPWRMNEAWADRISMGNVFLSWGCCS